MHVDMSKLCKMIMVTMLLHLSVYTDTYYKIHQTTHF